MELLHRQNLSGRFLDDDWNWFAVDSTSFSDKVRITCPAVQMIAFLHSIILHQVQVYKRQWHERITASGLGNSKKNENQEEEEQYEIRNNYIV